MLNMLNEHSTSNASSAAPPHSFFEKFEWGYRNIANYV